MASFHEFAFFVSGLRLVIGQHTIDDSTLYHRLITVVRMHENEKGIFFNESCYAFFTITAITKKQFCIIITEVLEHKPLKPSIILLLPLLKKESLEEAVYGAVEAGVSEIQLVITEKVKRAWQGDKEYDRLIKMVHAAQEQAKYFSPVLLHKPLLLDDALQKYHTIPIYFADPLGSPVNSFTKISDVIALFVGPEGDLTEKEKSLLVVRAAQFFSLTPTILRARQAAIIAVALFRSFFKS